MRDHIYIVEGILFDEDKMVFDEDLLDRVRGEEEEVFVINTGENEGGDAVLYTKKLIEVGDDCIYKLDNSFIEPINSKLIDMCKRITYFDLETCVENYGRYVVVSYL